VRMVGPSMLKPPPTKPLSPKEERAVLAPMERENELKQRRKAHLKAKKAKSSFRWPRSYSEDVLAFAERFETEWKKTIEGIIGAGKVVQEAKDELGYGKYGAFLEKIELSERIAEMLMTIARNKDLSNPKNFSVLPPRYTSLYRLGLLPEGRVQELINFGKIHRFMRGKEVKALAFRTLDRAPGIFEGVAMLMREYPTNKLDPLVAGMKHLFDEDKLTLLDAMEHAPGWFEKLYDAWQRAQEHKDARSSVRMAHARSRADDRERTRSVRAKKKAERDYYWREVTVDDY
jgi:hypothetical protein